jgi:hypothetical protein
MGNAKHMVLWCRRFHAVLEDDDGTNDTMASLRKVYDVVRAGKGYAFDIDDFVTKYTGAMETWQAKRRANGPPSPPSMHRCTFHRTAPQLRCTAVVHSTCAQLRCTAAVHSRSARCTAQL